MFQKSSRSFSIDEISEKQIKSQQGDAFTDCHFFLTTGCTNGYLCRYRHQEEIKNNPNTPECRNWLNYNCSDANCHYKHSPRKANPKETVCWFYVNSHCTNGVNCPFIHPNVNKKSKALNIGKNISLGDLESTPNQNNYQNNYKINRENFKKNEKNVGEVQNRSKSLNPDSKSTSTSYISLQSTSTPKTETKNVNKDEIRKRISERVTFGKSNESSNSGKNESNHQEKPDLFASEKKQELNPHLNAATQQSQQLLNPTLSKQEPPLEQSISKNKDHINEHSENQSSLNETNLKRKRTEKIVEKNKKSKTTAETKEEEDDLEFLNDLI